MIEKPQNWFLHVDLDAFFASVEQLDNPEYRGKPVIVGGLPTDRRSVVSTASYEARKFGVHSAMPTFKAYELCPQGIFVYGRMKRYSELSWQIMNIFSNYSPDVMQMSIDEAFIDITGTENLFGPPDVTAKKIKEHVKRETGLTVSVGLAPTKYLAKIASAMSKPDGFYQINPGEEQDFMLNLSLDKVWGIGNKTLEKLNHSGLHTTRDIYEKSFDFLEFLLGKNTASFLYNSVRGIEVETFSSKTKNHSISAETTFTYDIYDSYIAETEILELAHHVMFRLLREKGFSKTAFLKIRYEDFSTVSIQKTLENNIQTLDGFFDVLKKLFETKFEKGRGIRLLGVGFDNITKTEGPKQLELFEELSADTEKKSQVEQAILKLEQKHPEIKIHKARLLESINRQTKIIFAAVFFSILQLFVSSGISGLFAEERTINSIGAGSIITDNFDRETTEEAPVSLFDWKINDSNTVEFQSQGYWQSLFTVPFTATFGYDNSFNFGQIVPVFKQEVDLSLWALLNKKWYAEAEFSDEFNKNTFALGYKGESYLRHVRIANRGIFNSTNYSASIFGYDLKSGTNQAPGIMLHMEDYLNHKWESDFILKYETGIQKSAVFYGNNKVSDSYISVENYVCSRYFALPSNALSQIRDVYVESSRGKYIDSYGRKFIKLSTAEYQTIRSQNLLLISTNVDSEFLQPVILITFYNDFYTEELINQLGSYSDESSFLGKIQTFFSQEDKSIDLAKYSYELKTNIENYSALIIQNSTKFSPFICAGFYDTGLNSSAELYLISAATEKPLENFSVEYSDSAFNILQEDFTSTERFYAQIINNSFTSSFNYINPEYRYPLADKLPELYLSSKTTGDTVICVRNYLPVNEITIGKDAIPDTVNVFINNQKEWNYIFNSNTGVITLTKSVSFTDKILITWQEETNSLKNGALAGGAGFKYHFNPSTTADFFISTKWPVSYNTTASDYKNHNDTIASDYKNHPSGFAAFSAGIEYKNDYFLITDKSAVSIKNENTSGICIANNQASKISQTYYLGLTDLYKTKVIPLLQSDNFTTPLLTISNHGIEDDLSGSTDSSITGYKLPLSWNFSNINQDQICWASKDIKLSNGNLLSKSSELEIALKPEKTALMQNDYDVYLQLGIKAEENFSGENYNNIVTYKITGIEDSAVISKLNLSNENWQTVRIRLSDYDRAKLISSHDLRIIVVSNNSGSSKQGRIFVGPYEPVVQNVYISAGKNISIRENIYNRYTDDYASIISWNNENPSAEESNLRIISVSNFSASDFTTYKTINLDFAYQFNSISSGTGFSDDFFTLILDTGAVNPAEDGEIAIKAIIKKSQASKIASNSLVWHQLSVNLQNRQLYLDGTELPENSYELYINKKIIPSRQKIIFNLLDNKNLYNSGHLYIDNLYYKDCSPTLNGENYFYTEYKNQSKLTKTYISLESIQSGNIKTSQELYENNTEGSISGTLFGDFSITKLNFKGDISAAIDSNSTNNKPIKQAGHELKTISPLFHSISFSEKYRFIPSNSSVSKIDEAGILIPSMPMNLLVKTQGQQNLNSQNQKTTADFSLELPINYAKPKFTAGILSEQKLTINNDKNKFFEIDNYAVTWKDISELQFSYGYSNANLRNISLHTDFQTLFPEFYSFTPKISYELKGTYKSSSFSSFTDLEIIKLEIPFTFTNTSVSFNLSKTGQGLFSIEKGGNYFSDSGILSDIQSSRWWFYTSVPFNDLFNKELRDFVYQSKGETISYNTKYEILWKRKMLNNFGDIIIPSNLSLCTTRDIHGSDKLSDITQIKITLSQNAVNIFGKNGCLSFFNWYESDEIISSFSYALKMPYNADFLHEGSGYLQILFYIDQENSLKTGIDYSFSDNYLWSVKTTGLWKRNSKINPLVDIILFIFPKINHQNFKTIRKDSITISFINTASNFKQSYEYSHFTDTTFHKNYTLITGLSINYSDTVNKIKSLGLELSVGGKLNF